MDGTELLPEPTSSTLYDDSYGVKGVNESRKLISYAPQLPKHGIAMRLIASLILELNLFNHEKNSTKLVDLEYSQMNIRICEEFYGQYTNKMYRICKISKPVTQC